MQWGHNLFCEAAAAAPMLSAADKKPKEGVKTQDKSPYTFEVVG